MVVVVRKWERRSVLPSRTTPMSRITNPIKNPAVLRASFFCCLATLMRDRPIRLLEIGGVAGLGRAVGRDLAVLVGSNACRQVCMVFFWIRYGQFIGYSPDGIVNDPQSIIGKISLRDLFSVLTLPFLFNIAFPHHPQFLGKLLLLYQPPHCSPGR